MTPATAVSLVLSGVATAVAVASVVVSWLGIRRAQADRRHQSEDEWTREWARQRPVVYPFVLREWAERTAGGAYELSGNTRVLPLKNGGRGPALDVQGEVTATTPDGTSYTRKLLAGTIAAGDLLDGRLVPTPGIEHWGTAQITLRYSDLAGGLYSAAFRSELGPGGELTISAARDVQQTAAEVEASERGGQDASNVR